MASTAYIIWLCIVLFSPSLLLAEPELTAGVAANFILPFEGLSSVFEQKTAIRVKATFTSTGNLYSQIKNGAPYALFLSADEVHPRMHQQEKLPCRDPRGARVVGETTRGSSDGRCRIIIIAERNFHAGESSRMIWFDSPGCLQFLGSLAVTCDSKTTENTDMGYQLLPRVDALFCLQTDRFCGETACGFRWPQHSRLLSA